MKQYNWHAGSTSSCCCTALNSTTVDSHAAAAVASYCCRKRVCIKACDQHIHTRNKAGKFILHLFHANLLLLDIHLHGSAVAAAWCLLLLLLV
jgi:hypothetical protein